MGEEFQLPVATVVGSAERPVKIFKTGWASDGLKLAVPFWHRCFGSLAPGLETILEGTFCMAKSGLPLLPIFQRYHQSWEDDKYVREEVLIPVLSEWLMAGSLEYAERFHRLPHCTLAVGAVEKATAPFRRLVTDARPIDIFAESWRVKYTTVGDVWSARPYSCCRLQPACLRPQV